MEQTRLNITLSIIYYIKGYMSVIMEAIVTVKKVGGSLMARIPAEAADKLGIKENDRITLDIRKTKKSYLGVYKGLGKPFTEDDRFDSGRD